MYFPLSSTIFALPSFVTLSLRVFLPSLPSAALTFKNDNSFYYHGPLQSSLCLHNPCNVTLAFLLLEQYADVAVEVLNHEPDVSIL